jgi:hypothetical protein
LQNAGRFISRTRALFLYEFQSFNALLGPLSRPMRILRAWVSAKFHCTASLYLSGTGVEDITTPLDLEGGMARAFRLLGIENNSSRS